jgi:hypothetical protein
LGLPDKSTTDQIYQRAEELGLELCPAEVGPHLRLQYQDQPMSEFLHIGMKQITDSHGDPDVFRLYRDEGGRWLSGGWARPSGHWDRDSKFVFRLRQPSFPPDGGA